MSDFGEGMSFHKELQSKVWKTIFLIVLEKVKKFKEIFVKTSLNFLFFVVVGFSLVCLDSSTFFLYNFIFVLLPS